MKYEESEKNLKSSASHNAYEKNIGYIHKRTIELQKDNNSLYGSDELINKYSREDVRYDIRFHLYPGISAVQTMGGNSVLIQIKKREILKNA